MTDIESVVAVLRAQPEVEYRTELHSPPHRGAQRPSLLGAVESLVGADPTGVGHRQGGSASLIVAVVDSGLAHLDTTFQFRYWNGRRFRQSLCRSRRRMT